MCKNAGKTTVLNKVIAEMNQARRRIGVTSIGRDGEGVDVVTRTRKPGIYVREGTLCVTAENLLRYCDASREIIAATNIFTPLGEVVIFRTHSDGYVQLAGPSGTRQLRHIVNTLQGYGAELAIVDGAVSRKSLGAPSVCEAVILCTGASYNPDIYTVVEDTAFIVSMLSLPMQNAFTEDELVKVPGAMAIKTELGDCAQLESGIALADALRSVGADAVGGIYCGIYFSGAVTDALLEPIIAAGIRLDGVSLTVHDGTRMLLGRGCYDKITHLGARFMAVHTINLIAVTVNPVSAYGYNLDKAQLQTLMQERVSIPVVDVNIPIGNVEGDSW